MEIDLSRLSLKKLQLFDKKLLFAIETIQNKHPKDKNDYNKITRLSFLRHHVRTYSTNRSKGEIDLINNIVSYR